MAEQTLTRAAVLVTGSRTWRRTSIALAEFDQIEFDILSRRLADGPSQCLLINGGAPGADELIAGAATGMGWQVRTVRPDYDRYPPKVAPLRRNDAMIQMLSQLRAGGAHCTAIALWKDHSGGTGYTVDRMRAAGFDPTIVYDCPCHPEAHYPNK